MNTALDVFKKVSEHLLTQNEQALDGNWECVYRSDTGLKCAVGCLIDDEFYSEDLEYSVFDRTGSVANALHKSGVILTNEILDLLRRLQKLHDFKEPESWQEELEKLNITFFKGEAWLKRLGREITYEPAN